MMTIITIPTIPTRIIMMTLRILIITTFIIMTIPTIT
jgi:hypothetical protein